MLKLRILAALVALCAVLASGWYIHSLRSSNASLRADMALLVTSNENLKAQVQRERELSEQARTVARDSANKAKAARKGTQDAKNSEWGNTRLPDSVIDGLQ